MLPDWANRTPSWWLYGCGDDRGGGFGYAYAYIEGPGGRVPEITLGAGNGDLWDRGYGGESAGLQDTATTIEILASSG
jgi:hypothetical protein